MEDNVPQRVKPATTGSSRSLAKIEHCQEDRATGEDDCLAGYVDTKSQGASDYHDAQESLLE